MQYGQSGYLIKKTNDTSFIQLVQVLKTQIDRHPVYVKTPTHKENFHHGSISSPLCENKTYMRFVLDKILQESQPPGQVEHIVDHQAQQSY